MNQFAFSSAAGRLKLTLSLILCWLGNAPLAQAGPGVDYYKPDNVHRAVSVLPPNLQRVVLLPLVSDNKSGALEAGRDALEPILRSELIKTKKLEVVAISADTLRRRTGRAAWSASDKLPADFFQTLQEATGCDAVLFAELTVFRPYAPLAIGWRLRLVDTRTQLTLWAADEVFDAGRPEVAKGARRYGQRERKVSSGEADQWSMLNCPRWFGRYTATVLLAAIPER